ncbi:cupredoxin domain-containing protein [Leucobacter denitrificans]|uniref:Cupredoxin domain-containing protein n=1 Tax=Leucobacter denitrificans TaxID=683042 RepID=A0A7G9S1Z6_9MICO|nr:cupredoxin domain-containing protein [Leucobacter denitrificans]QNN61871.1 cupredoxin domain-containing protein [Leucobacter denitrificans]
MSRRIAARAAATLGALTLALTLAACASPPEVVPSDDGVEPAVVVTVIDNRYEPSEVEIEAGEAVQWVFQGSAKHDVVADDGSFVSELMYEGTYTHVFDESGEFPYVCSIHPEMTGVVHVN